MKPTNDLFESIVGDVQAIVRTGLPLKMIAADSPVLSLRGVVSRAADNDVASLVAALDGLLRLQLAQLSDPALKAAALCLFGGTNECSNRSLTFRRQRAATAAVYEAHHFRKRVEPKLLAAIATALIADSEGYNRSRAVAPSLIVETRRPGPLPDDAWAWEAVEHEETLLRVWAAVYGLRAQLLAVERLLSMGSSIEDLVEEAERALWLTARLVSLSRRYQTAYGGRLVQNVSEIVPEDFIALAGWTPTLSGPEKRHLADLAVEISEPEFLRALKSDAGGRRLAARWAQELSRSSETQD